MRLRLELALALALAAPAVARAVDCAPATTVCVPEEAGLEAAFLSVPHGGIIDVAAGTYPAPTTDTGFRVGTTTAARNRSFTVRARSGPGTVTLTGQSARRIVVLDRLDPARWITFEGLRFVNGRTATANVAGGVTLKNARATFVDCEFVGNRAAAGALGGAGLGLYGGAKALLVRTRFENNRAITEGAAIFAQKGFAPYDTPSEVWIQASTFRNNCETGNLADCSSGNGPGGAILVRNSRLRVADSLFEGNVAGWVGGAVYSFGAFAAAAPYCDFSAPATDVLIVRSRFAGNAAGGAAARPEAGALHVENCARARVYQSVFEDNVAGWGGAIELYHGRLELVQSVLRGNRTQALAGETVELGGTLAAFSGDSAGDPDYPSAQVIIDRSLFDARPAGTLDAQRGGCIAVQGDLPRTLAGACTAGQLGKCAQLTVTDTAFLGCDAGALGGSGQGTGGALSLYRTHATLSNVLIARSSATGTNGRGGGIEASLQSGGALAGVAFSGNSASGLDPDLAVLGGSTLSQANVRYWSATQGPPADGRLLALPTELVADTARTQGEAWLAYAWAGNGARLDGVVLGTSPKNGLEAAADGLHTLDVDNGNAERTAEIVTAALPATTLAATRNCAAGTAQLAWTTPGGTFLAGLVDRNVGGGGAAGTATVALEGEVTYRRFVLTGQGGALASAAVSVTCPIFVDGFENGSASRWSSIQG